MRQYIGARYVPKYYQNSLDPDSTEWESNVSYEPLTIVTLPNQHSYISKKFVPATVGTPADNSEYWLDQGSESAYIEVLQQEIDDMKDGTVEGSLQYQIDDIVNNLHAVDFANVKDYGAKGDGTTDDRQAIINAIASGKMVFFPQGYYRVSAPITISTGTAIIGSGTGKTIITFDTQSDPNNYVFDGSSETVKTNIMIRDLTINVNTYTQDVGFTGGIFLMNTVGFMIQNVEVLNTSNGGNGITLWGCSNGCIDGCYLHQLYGDGIYVSNSSYNVTVSNNTVLNCTVTSGCIDLYLAYHVTCVGNHVQPNNTSTFGFNLDTVEHCSIIGNTCFNGIRGIAGFVINHCVIANNVVRQCNQMGIQIEHSVDGVTASNHNIVEGNEIYNCEFGIVDTGYGYYDKFVNNMISLSKKHGIYLIGCQAADVDGNTIEASSQETANTYSDIVCAPKSGDTSNYIKISNNICNSPAAKRNIECQADVDYLTIIGNQLMAFGGDYNMVVATQTNMISDNNRGTAA